MDKQHRNAKGKTVARTLRSKPTCSVKRCRSPARIIPPAGKCGPLVGKAKYPDQTCPCELVTIREKLKTNIDNIRMNTLMSRYGGFVGDDDDVDDGASAGKLKKELRESGRAYKPLDVSYLEALKAEISEYRRNLVKNITCLQERLAQRRDDEALQELEGQGIFPETIQNLDKLTSNAEESLNKIIDLGGPTTPAIAMGYAPIDDFRVRSDAEPPEQELEYVHEAKDLENESCTSKSDVYLGTISEKTEPDLSKEELEALDLDVDVPLPESSPEIPPEVTVDRVAEVELPKLESEQSLKGQPKKLCVQRIPSVEINRQLVKQQVLKIDIKPVEKIESKSTPQANVKYIECVYAEQVEELPPNQRVESEKIGLNETDPQALIKEDIARNLCYIECMRKQRELNQGGTSKVKIEEQFFNRISKIREDVETMVKKETESSKQLIIKCIDILSDQHVDKSKVLKENSTQCGDEEVSSTSSKHAQTHLSCKDNAGLVCEFLTKFDKAAEASLDASREIAEIPEKDVAIETLYLEDASRAKYTVEAVTSEDSQSIPCVCYDDDDDDAIKIVVPVNDEEIDASEIEISQLLSNSRTFLNEQKIIDVQNPILNTPKSDTQIGIKSYPSTKSNKSTPLNTHKRVSYIDSSDIDNEYVLVHDVSLQVSLEEIHQPTEVNQRTDSMYTYEFKPNKVPPTSSTFTLSKDLYSLYGAEDFQKLARSGLVLQETSRDSDATKHSAEVIYPAKPDNQTVVVMHNTPTGDSIDLKKYFRECKYIHSPQIPQKKRTDSESSELSNINVDSSVSEGEIRCQSNVSCGEIHKCKVKKHLDLFKFGSREKAAGKKRFSKNSWISFYFSRNKSPGESAKFRKW